MDTPNRDLNMSTLQYSSSPDLSSLPSGSPSDPGSPPRPDQRRTSYNATTASRFTMASQQSPQHSNQMPELFSLSGVRLTKDGVPRKKPGRKPGTTVAKKAGDGTNPTMSDAAATASGSGVEAAKPKRPRKPKDPNAPVVPRKKRTATSDASDTIGSTGLSRSSSANMHFEPKLELTSMRMDIDSRPAPRSLGPPAILHQQPRQPPLSMMDKPKREHPSSMMSILNADDSPPRPSQPAPTSTTPVRSVGQSYDPVRSSTYDPVRGTMVSRDPYGTGPLGSPRAPSHVTANRASASPSIASLVDPAPSSHARSPVGHFAVASQQSPPTMSIAAATTSSIPPSSRYRENIPSLPPSPSPAPPMSTFAPPQPVSSTKPSPQAAPMSKTASANTEATPPMAMMSSLTDASRPPSDAATASEPKSAAKKETNGESKSSSKPPPPPPVPAAAKATTTKSASTKAAEKAAEKAERAAEKAAEKAEKAAEKAAEKKAAAAAKAAVKTAKATAKTAKATKANGKSGAATEASAPSSPDASADGKASDPKASTTSEDVVMSGTESAGPTNNAPHIKKFASILQQERGAKSAASSPKLSATKADNVGALAVLDATTGGEPERSILDFGKALPGEENTVPSIVLHIPLVQGETNTYINFMRLAEDRFGWDALHPRLAAHRDRKLRIAAASAALERNGSGRESGDEMTDDMQSGDEGSNEENGADNNNNTNNNTGPNASGVDEAPAKPARKKRTFKEDEYDRDDDFVDDSEMLWEEQAAASRDGFFVYSGPLVPEEEKPEEGTSTPAKRGGRGSRGGRGGARAGAGRTTTGTTRRGGGPGSRGGTTYRRPRMTKLEKEQREREKAESEGTKTKTTSKAKAAKAAAAAADNGDDTDSPFSTSMAIDL